MTDFEALNNPVWNSLASAHRKLSIRQGAAARFPPEISLLAGLEEPTAEAFADLRTLVPPNARVSLFSAEPLPVPGDWQVVVSRRLHQMSCAVPLQPGPHAIVPLDDENVREMMQLVAATDPGPFQERTILIGEYFGIRSDDGRLISMAGRRMAPDGFSELSSVCTLQDAQRRGCATALIRFLAHRIQSEGKMPFLHVNAEKEAVAVYEKIGFVIRRSMHVTIVTPAP